MRTDPRSVVRWSVWPSRVSTDPVRSAARCGPGLPPGEGSGRAKLNCGPARHAIASHAPAKPPQTRKRIGFHPSVMFSMEERDRFLLHLARPNLPQSRGAAQPHVAVGIVL